jgi:hypothetical protein
VSSISALRRHVSDAVSGHSDITNLSFRDQWQILILNLLSKLEDNKSNASYVLVVDALDECDDDRDIGIVLELLADARALKVAQLRVFLTSRPKGPIRYGISKTPNIGRKDFILHNITQSIVDHDISMFLEHKLEIVA